MLNYKKNGDPFWNLLYVGMSRPSIFPLYRVTSTNSSQAPLFNPDGTVAFYIGGQINCSTTVHSYTDILKILSLSDNPEEDEEPERPKTSRDGKSKRSRWRLLWSGERRDKVEVRETGMESQLLKKIEKMSLGSQMKLFYTAYSKVSYSSDGMPEPVLTQVSISISSFSSTP